MCVSACARARLASCCITYGQVMQLPLHCVRADKLHFAFRGCPKVYHPACIKRDESFFRCQGKWDCGELFSCGLRLLLSV